MSALADRPRASSRDWAAADEIVNVAPEEGRDLQPDLPRTDDYAAENDKAIVRSGAVEEWSKKLPGGH